MPIATVAVPSVAPKPVPVIVRGEPTESVVGETEVMARVPTGVGVGVGTGVGVGVGVCVGVGVGVGVGDAAATVK
jgi:hypothetical protein